MDDIYLSPSIRKELIVMTPLIEATLRLFNCIPVLKHLTNPLEIGEDIMKRTIRNGYILDPTILPDPQILDTIEKIVGVSGEKANAAFHKSWSVIRDSSMEQLVAQQILHYITTYGFEALGIYSKEAVYIPNEKLEVPEITDDIPLVVIRAMTAEEILESILKLGTSGIALSSETLDDIMTVFKSNRLKVRSDLDTIVITITNRELKSRLCDFYNIAPSEPVEFLRYLVNKLTGESLLIKNRELIKKIKEADGRLLDQLLEKAPIDLPSIFLRYKPLFLAMKKISVKNKSLFNWMRKKANRMHVPLKEDYLNNVTNHIKHGKIDNIRLAKKLESASIFRKIRLAYALRYRLNPGSSIIYKVRNGKGWADDFDWPSFFTDETMIAINIVVSSIVSDIRKNVEGKTILIPNNIHYTLPATEKQFTGNFPTGSYVSVPHHMMVGIHWENTNRRIDLDLSVIGESGKYGWDTSYRSKDRCSVLFSGDVTDAPEPKGATELFYLSNAPQEPRILMVNYYNFNKEDPVPAKIIVAQEQTTNLEKNYMVDPNNIIAAPLININKKQNVLGLVANVDGENRVYFSHVSVGNAISSRQDRLSRISREYLVNSVIKSIDLAEILRSACANVVSEKPDEEEYIDLSPSALDKTTIIDLILPKQ